MTILINQVYFYKTVAFHPPFFSFSFSQWFVFVQKHIYFLLDLVEAVHYLRVWIFS